MLLSAEIAPATCGSGKPADSSDNHKNHLDQPLPFPGRHCAARASHRNDALLRVSSLLSHPHSDRAVITRHPGLLITRSQWHKSRQSDVFYNSHGRGRVCLLLGPLLIVGQQQKTQRRRGEREFLANFMIRTAVAVFAFVPGLTTLIVGLAPTGQQAQLGGRENSS